MKWDSKIIIDFLKIFEQYPVLWNIKHKDYCNLKLRDVVFKQMCEELEAEKLLQGINEKQLKAKIKSVKDVYKQELGKTERSKKNGSGAEEIYSPKLQWFDSASFLGEVLSTRRSQSNLVRVY